MNYPAPHPLRWQLLFTRKRWCGDHASLFTDIGTTYTVLNIRTLFIFLCSIIITLELHSIAAQSTAVTPLGTKWRCCLALNLVLCNKLET